MNQGGRPKNVTEKGLEDALAPIHEAIAKLTRANHGGTMTRAEFLGQMMIAMAAHRGEIAFSDRFVNSMTNQADTMYEGYLKMATGGGPTNKELLDSAQEQIRDLQRKVTLAEAREATLEEAFKETQKHAEATGQGS